MRSDSGGWCQQTRKPGGDSPVVTVRGPGFFGSESRCSHPQDRPLGTVLSSSVDLTLEHWQPSEGHAPALLVSGGGD